MIEVSGLTKRYGDLLALDDVSFTVEPGQIVGFLGANGAGKTTTMDIICGCIGADRGSVKICGLDVTDKPEQAKLHLGYLPDEPPLYHDMRVEEYITYAARLHRMRGKDLLRAVEETIEKLSLSQVRRRLVGQLSKGFRQRVGLAQAIVHSPDVLVLDEPTEGLDPTQIIHIRELIKGLAGQHTILLSSHILSEVQNTCERIMIIHEGRLVQQGTYEEILQHVEGARKFTLSVATDVSSLVEKLNTVPGVSSASQDGEAIDLTLANDGGDLDAIAKVVIEGGHGLREIAAKKRSLEDAFIELTH